MSTPQTPSSVSSATLSRARVVGMRTAMILALLMGGTLTVFTLGSHPLTVCIVVVTALVVLAARPLGARVGVAAVQHGWGHALTRGVLGALACLLVAAVGASMVGGLWGLTEASSASELLQRYFSLAFVVVALFGAPFAIVLGAVHGLLVRCIVRS